MLCNACTLVQQRYTVDPRYLYSNGYWYRSGVTATMRAALKDVVDEATKRVNLQSGDIVVDIGSNDGTLLKSYSVEGLQRIGYEPSSTFSQEEYTGLELVPEYWGKGIWRDFIRDARKVKVVTALGMLYDLEDPNQFVADVKTALAPDGIFIAQLMCLGNMMRANDLGNLAHEHLEFYSLASLARLFRKHGLEIYGLEENSVNGGSYRFYIRHETGIINDRWLEELIREKKLTYATAAYQRYFFQRMARNRIAVVDFIRREKEAGKRIWVYGASTKGNVILQWYGLDKSLIDGASERSSAKWGLVTAGTGIPICSEEEAREANPDYFLVLPYAFLEEFKDREREWRDRGGKFIVPLPELRIV